MKGGKNHVIKPVQLVTQNDVSVFRHQQSTDCKKHNKQQMYCTLCQYSSCETCFKEYETNYTCEHQLIAIMQADEEYIFKLKVLIKEYMENMKLYVEEVNKTTKLINSHKLDKESLLEELSLFFTEIRKKLHGSVLNYHYELENLEKHVVQTINTIADQNKQKLDNNLLSAQQRLKIHNEAVSLFRKCLPPNSSFESRFKLVNDKKYHVSAEDKSATNINPGVFKKIVTDLKANVRLVQRRQYNISKYKTLTIGPMKNECVNILSFHEDKLLAGCAELNELFIYDLDTESLLMTIKLPKSCDKLCDAVWSFDCNIFCTCDKQTFLLLGGEVIKVDSLIDPRCLYVNQSHVLLADYVNGIFVWRREYKDWINSSVYNKNNGDYHPWQVLLIEGTENILYTRNAVFLCVEFDSKKQCRLQKYVFSAYKGIEETKTIILKTNRNKILDVSKTSIAVDAYCGIFVADCTTNGVYLFSLDGEFKCQLLSDTDGLNRPCKIALYTERKLLYIGQQNGEVHVFQMKDIEWKTELKLPLCV